MVRHKEDGIRELRPVLARVLAASVTELLAGVLRDDPEAVPVGRVLLVPVPSRAQVRRSRGDDPWAGVCRDAAVLLRGRGVPARAVGLLRVRSGVRDQAGLGRTERYANVRGQFEARERAVARVRAEPSTALVLCDDVLTTGATLGAAAAALSEAQVAPVGCVVLSEAGRDAGPRGRNVATN